jgi:dihydrofolate reductase
MRKVITGAFISLDGVMQAPGGPTEDPANGFSYGGWVAPLVDEEFGKAVDELFARKFDLLLGRKTYEIFAAHWPYQDEAEPIAKQLNSARKYVATRSDMPLTWSGSVALHDAAADVARLKQEDGPDLITQGSTDLIQTLLANDLIDEFVLFTFPVVLGSGKRLFGAGAKPMAFEAADTRVTAVGTTITSYRRSGPLKTGDFAMDPPTAAELERRKKWAAEA